MRKQPAWAFVALLAALGTAFVAHDADAARRRRNKKPKVGVITDLLTPLGLQGKLGAGYSVLFSFRLNDLSQRTHEVDVEYGHDLDGDGVIDPDNEYRTASLDTRAERQTATVVENRRGRQRLFYDSLREPGEPHVVVWNSVQDIEKDGILVTAASPGVRIRVRPRRKKGRRRTGEWVYTDAFSLENRSRPAVRLDRVVAGQPTEVQWTAVNADSEDANGNGEVDFVEGEDRNGNGLADLAPLDAEFDFYVLQEGEETAGLPEFALAELDWDSCTQDPLAGDPAIQVASSPVGLDYTFAWDAEADLPAPAVRVILRTRVRVDDTLLSDWEYLATPFTPSE